MSSDLSFSQLEAAWEQGGGAPSLAPVMAAIAEAESGGNPTAVGDTSPINGVLAPSYGLWQIRSVHANSIPNFFPQQGSSEWENPAQNASAALSILDSQGLSAWSTFTSGAYKQYLPGGSSFNAGGINPAIPGNAPLFGPGQSAASAAANAAGSAVADAVPTWLAALLQPLSDWWKAHPVGLLLIALFVTIIGIAFILTDKNVQGVIQSAKPVPVPV